MSIEITDICPKFTSIDNASFKRKVYDSCLLFAMENYNNLKKSYSQDNFPSQIYYNLEDRLKNDKTTQKIVGPPKKKRNPVTKSQTKDLDSEDNGDSSKSTSSESKSPEKLKAKKYPLTLNRSAKSMIDFIINRFLWEVYHIEPSNDEECPESKIDIEKYILEHVCSDFTKNCNISELIIYSVKAFQPSKIIVESYGLDKELRAKFDEHVDNGSFTNVIAEYTTDFIKLIMIFFTNRFWLEKTQTVNIKIFETVMRYLELSIPVSCKTVSKGLMNDMLDYDKLINPAKISDKAPDKKALDKKAPDKKALDKKAPDKKALDKKAPDKKAPDKKAPDKKAPDKKAPDKKAPNKKAPNKKSPDKKEESDEEESDNEHEHDYDEQYSDGE
jgi:hypothetical protein